MGCGNSSIVNNGVEIPSSDEYLLQISDCTFFFSENFQMQRNDNIISLTVPVSGAVVDSELKTDNTFDFQVDDEAGGTADCVGEFTETDSLEFECVTTADTCTAKYNRNDAN